MAERYTPGSEASNASYRSFQIGNDPNIPGIRTNQIEQIESADRKANGEVSTASDMKRYPLIALLVAGTVAIAIVRWAAGAGPVENWSPWVRNPLWPSIIGLVLGAELAFLLVFGVYGSSKHASTSGWWWQVVSKAIRWPLGFVTFLLITYAVMWVYFVLCGAQIGRNVFEGMLPFNLFLNEPSELFKTVRTGLIVLVGVSFCVRALYIGTRN